MKDDDRENRPKLRYFRYGVIFFTALLVLSLGFSLIPEDPPAPADPPFSEQARVAALEDSLDLRTAAERLAAAASTGGAAHPAVLEGTVTLLTLQARALLAPSDSSAGQDASAYASSPAAGSPVTDSPAAAPTFAELASALSASGSQRLADAELADGGMARLLAGAGTAQLLAAENIAAAGGVAVATLPHTGAAPAAGTTAPAPNATASACPPSLPASTNAPQESSAEGTAANVGNALSAAVAAEQQSIYAYQAALPRLGAGDAQAAEAFLAQHQELAAGAEARSRAACSAPQPQQPGFVLPPGFLATPGDGLARLELSALPAYGDIIAKADGGLRTWAIAALQSGARRADRWGAPPGPVPGVVLDQDQLPELPVNTAAGHPGSSVR